MKVRPVSENLAEYILSSLGVLPAPLVDTFQAIVRARAIMVATKLGIFETLQHGPKSSGEIAQQLQIDHRATEKLLSGLVGAGYLRIAGTGYDLSRTARKWLLGNRAVHVEPVFFCKGIGDQQGVGKCKEDKRVVHRGVGVFEFV